MDVFELSVFTFMFCRSKNEEEGMKIFGPDNSEINEGLKEVDNGNDTL